MKKLIASCTSYQAILKLCLLLCTVTFQTNADAQQPGNALVFDGSNDYVALPNALATAATLSSNNAITIEYWFKGTSLLSAVRIQNSNGYIIAGYGMQHIISTDGQTTGVGIPSGIYDGRWHHIAMTWQKAAINGFKSYVDGQLYAERNAANANLPVVTSGAYLGTFNTASEFTNGALDEVRIYNIALTQANIQYDMVNGNSAVPLSLLAQYHFNQGNAGSSNTGLTILRDTSGHAYHGTLMNFALTGTTSNWVESYAMVRPVANAATNVTGSGFTANWSGVNLGTVTNFQLDVSTNPDFTGHISGSPFNNISSTTFSQAVTGLSPGTYYYRVRANKTSVSNTGCNSAVVAVTIPYVAPGNAIALDGSKDFISLPQSILASLSNATIESWFLWNGGNGWQRVFDFGSGTGRYLFFTPKPAGGEQRALFNIFNGSASYSLYTLQPLIQGKWYHVAVTFNSSTNTGKLYLNGELQDEENIPIYPSGLGNTTQNWLGLSQYGQDPYFNGRIDEFRLWNVTRTQAEIQAGMKAPVSLSTTGLVSYYHFNYGVDGANNAGVTTMTDQKDSTRTATLNSNIALTGTVSNWVESYAQVIPVANAATSMVPGGFAANWTAPSTGTVTNYVLDVSQYNDFSSVISGSPFTVTGTTSKVITGLSANTNYYYRVRADKSSVTGQGAITNTIVARTASGVTPPGNCLNLDGSDDYITVPTSTGINNQFANDHITVETWVNPKAVPNAGQMIALVTESYLGEHNVLFSIYLWNGSVYAGFHNGYDWTQAGLQYSLPVGRWSHLAGTYDKNQIRLYIDGALVATHNTTASLPNGQQEWRIGRRWDYNECFNGYMDEVRIYNEALTGAQINYDMRDTLSALPGSLVAYYNFDQGNAGSSNTGLTILTDRSNSAGYNAYLQNFALSGSNSNYISSYSLTIPTASSATSITSSGFTANWTAPKFGIVNNYFLDVSTSSDFTGPISGSPFTLSSSTLSQAITGLIPGTYYYRVRANSTSLANQGGVSNMVTVLVSYAPPGNALSFDGVNDVVVTALPSGINVNNFSMECWVYPTGTTNDWQTIFAYGFDNGQVGNGIALYIHPNSPGLYIQCPAIATPFTGYSFPEFNKWYHVALTRSNNVTKVYVNGVQTPNIGTAGVYSPTLECRLGGHTGIRHFKGKIDEFRLWNYVRTDAQVAAAYRSFMQPASTGLTAYYNFDQGVSGANNTTTDMVYDQTSNQLNGTLKNFALTGTTSNWVESYALVVPQAAAATAVTTSSFIAHWTPSLTGTTNNYLLDVSPVEDFSGSINNSPFTLPGTALSSSITSLTGGRYYYKVRSDKTSLTGQGASSNPISVDVPYTPPGNAIAFDGINDYGQSVSNTTGNFGTSDFTVEYWMKTYDESGYHITKRGNGCDGGQFWSMAHGIAGLNANQFYGEINNGGPYNNSFTFTMPKPINDGRWHHFAMVRQGVRVTVYIDGESVFTRTSSGVGNVNNGGPLYLGTSCCVFGNSQTLLEGSLDEVRLWNVARSQDSIIASMRHPVDAATPGLVNYYSFDQGVGGLTNHFITQLSDVKGNADNNIDLHNMTLEALNTNWVESYATVVPAMLEPSNITPSGFTLNWTTPAQGVVSNYFVDVSLSSNFTAPISGSPFTVAGNANSLDVTGLASSTFYCRVRANKSSSPVSGEGAPSNVKVIDLKYTQPGNALQFDGSNDYGLINNNLSGSFTIEFWTRTSQTGNTGSAFTQGNGIVACNNFGFSLLNGKIIFGLGSTNLQSVTTVNTGKWFHVAITRNGSTGSLKLFINGSQEIAATGSGGSLSPSAFQLGATYGTGGNSSNAYNGAIDELRIWSIERNSTEINQYFKDTIDRNTSGLLDYYRFDQGIGGANNTGVTTLKDISGSDNGGSITNFSLSGTSSNWVNSYGINVNGPSNLTATDNVCGQINLSWTNPSLPTTSCDVSVNCDPNYFRQYVYADDSLVAILPFSASSCSFDVNVYAMNTRLIRGPLYRFKVVTAYVPGLFTYIKFSQPSNIATGKFKPNPAVPSGFTASIVKCDGSVDLGWTWTDANPQNGWLVTRSLDSAQSAVTSVALPGTSRSYTDVGLQRGQLYYYRIYAQNDCYSSAAPDSMFAGVSDTLAVVGGISPQVPARPTNVRLFADSTTNLITVRWNDNSNNEDKFAVERAAIGGLTTLFDVNPNDTVFIDDQAAGCVAYNYTIKAYSGCAVNGIPSVGTNQTRLTPDLSNTFGSDTTIYKLKCSKGYYPDRVELNWNNRNSGQLNSIRIYRKVANSTNDSVLIASVLSGSGLYVDNTTVAGVLYRYYLVGELQCAGVTRFSNITSDIGFRSPSGIVNGTVSYVGGFSAQGVRVLAQNTSFNKGGGIALDGVNDYIEVPHRESQNPGSALTVEAWYKPITRNSFVIVSKMDSAAGGYTLQFDSTSNQLWFTLSDGVDSQVVAVDTPFVSFASYNQITSSYGTDSIRIYVNGIQRNTVPTMLLATGAPVTPLYLGGSPKLGIYGKGSIDEVRLWKVSKNGAQIANDFNRTVESNNGNLFAYYTFDDRFAGLTETYDQSNLNLVFNENHGRLVNGASFTDSIPTSSQLALASYTDDKGHYTIENVRYIGTGQNYTIVPSLDIHSFLPTNRIVFVGDGSQSLNSVDFIDNSSFEFTGKVTYAGTTCPATGAAVTIDGSFAVQDNQIVTVNDSGKFVVRVPIGSHYIALTQTKHTFNQGRFPDHGFFNFTGPVSASFTDSTFLTVVGRVAGGNRELNKLPGLGRSKNNIGKAQFTFTSVGQSGVTGCYSRSIVTNDSSGEYKAYLLPLRYTISGLRLVNNPDPTLLTNVDFNNPNLLDLTSIPEITNVVDTLVTPMFTRIDSVSYHKQLDFKYYSTPQIFVTDTNTPFVSLVNNFIGEDQVGINDSISISIRNNELGYPVFQQNKQYIAVVKVVEQYLNADKLPTDSTRLDIVPVSGTLRFYNSLALVSDSISEVPVNNGIYIYPFKGGVPNQLRNSVNPQYSYTRTMQIEFVPEIGTTVNYLPNENDLVSKFYRGYVFGSRPGGSNFTTKGPALVDFVLRDPPGSASSATWSKGTSYSKAESWSYSNSFSSSFSNMFDFGEKLQTFVGVGAGLGAFAFAGVIEEEETVFNLTLGVNESRTSTSEGEIVTTTTSNTTLSTGSDPGSVGPGADIYYGKSTNLIFGNADQVDLIDTATCAILDAQAGTSVCIGNAVNGYKIGKKTGFYLVPGGIATTFAYTQDEILNLVIPDLEALRNQLFTSNAMNIRGERKYTALFNDASDPDYARKFGANNDDPIWEGLRSTGTPFVREAKDTIGPSYVFHGDNRFETDSVRFFNDQIRLWKAAIARNEADKYKAINNSGTQPVAGGRNISIGKAMLTEDFTTQTDQTYTESFEVSLGVDLSLTVGFEVFGIGNEFTSTFSFEKTSGRSRSTTKSISNTFSYTLQDGDDGDLISVDIVDPKVGGSHIFKLRAGRTSCPYEGQVNAMFYDPNNDTITSTTLLDDGFEIQTATAQNDVPVISVDRNSNFNIPASDDAIFILDLGNLSEGHQDRTYSLRVNQATNPYGAILKVDGFDPNRDFDVPYGTTVQKTLTLKRGPVHYNYDNIQLILKSQCDDDIFDTISISAHFLPTCTSVELKSPEDRWVLNSSYHDTLPVLIGGYNYNWGGFQSLHFQYKPGGTNVWYDEKTYFKDTPDANIKIPLGDPNIYYPFNFKNLPDGNYELRAVTECITPGYPNTRLNSSVMQGLVDRVNPTPFGTPSPANGILSPNDDISIQFNEPIEQSTLSLSNFEVKGVLNKSDLVQNTSLYFDGDNDYLEVSQPLNLQQKPFTIEYWHKRGALGHQVLVSQGADSASSFETGFTSDDRFYFRVNGETVMSSVAITDTVGFSFYAVSYNSTAQTADLYINNQVVNIGNNRIFNPYSGAGRFYMGKASYGNPAFAKGNLYEVRLWGVARTLTDANQTKSKLLNGTEAGLIGNWRIDEATGNSVKDYARSRNAVIMNAQWYLAPMGKSYSFDGNGDFITVPTAHFGISKEMDFTLEFWFKGSNGNHVGMLSNGTGEATATNANLKWSIETDSIGRILVKHNGVNFLATNTSFFDGNWHHFALVLRRNSSLSCYVDANLQNSLPSGNFEQWGGAKLWFGAKGWNDNGNAQFDSTSNYFTGELDDLRFWNSSRLAEQLRRDKNTRLNGNEAGLVLYVPFESYEQVLGFPVLSASDREFTSPTRTISHFGDAVSADESPTIKLPRAAQDINFTYAVNGDKIIITPTTANEYIENVTLDITVKGIQDKNGNAMQSPKTWIAYVDKNQVKWQDDELVFDKTAGAPLTFQVTIVNSGGALKEFTIGNLPLWLKASVTNSTIKPSSTMDVVFTVDPTLNIGKYEQDLALTTDFGFADRLLIRMNVKAIAPAWSVNPSAYSKSMSIVGQVRINNVISANTDDLLGAFVNNVCRGVGHVQYYDQLDKYLVFMDVYGNTDNEPMEFRIWNSATGKTHVEVTPSLNFVSNTLVGNVTAPQVFNALDKVSQRIALSPGWNWVSFNLLTTDSANLNQLLGNLKPDNGNLIKNNTEMAVFDTATGWSGNLAAPNAGIKPEYAYLIRVQQPDTLEVRGVEANPQLRTISISQGWNYLGYVSQRNLSTNEALAGWTASQNDLIKGQNNFSVYDTVLGWVGSLATLIPNEGYLYKSATAGTFQYPRLAMFGKRAPVDPVVTSKYWKFDPHPFKTNMNLIGSVNVCGITGASDNWLLGAFVNDELRGFTNAADAYNQKLYFMSISGNENEKISFRLLDESSGNVYELSQQAVYTGNTVNGSLTQPVMFTASGATPCSNAISPASGTRVFPVPFTNELNIDISLQQSEKVTVRLLDISGQEMQGTTAEVYNTGRNSIRWDASRLSSGVYILEIEKSGDKIRTKVIKL
jgi:hypothetical protein